MEGRPGRVGLRARADRRAAGGDRLHDLHARARSRACPLNIVGSLQVPATDDAEVVGDEIDGFVAGLLALVGIESDPLSSREHILLANLIQHSWSQGAALDLPTLVGQIQQPPIRKLGVFELDQFYPPAERTKLAMKLNGLLASPSFAAWGAGPAARHPVDAVRARRHGPLRHRHDRPPLRRGAPVRHRRSMLSKLVTWMRRQSGTTDLRALLYMDEVAGYLPPTANPPTKQPIMLLMKQARAFGIGVVLSTQNPVDVDYKAISNAGTWMVGRLQTERDKQRLLDGMSAAAGTVDVGAVGDTISGLAKREFVLRRAGKDQPEVFTTRWAMSYLRGPMTRDQIELVMRGAAPAAAPAPRPDRRRWRRRRARPLPAPDAADGRAPRPPVAADPDATPVMPEVGGGVAVRWVDPAAPWLGAVGGAPASTTYAAAVVARVALRYDDAKADLVHDEEYEAVLFPLDQPPRRHDRDRRRLRRPRPARRGADAGRLPADRRADRRADVLEPAAQGPRRPPHAQPGAGDPDQHRAQAVRPTRRGRRRVRRPLPAGRRRQGRRGRRPSCAPSTRPRWASCRRRSRPPRAPPTSPASSRRPASATTCCRRPARSSAACSAAASRRGGLLGQLGRAAGRTGKTSAAGSRVEAAQGKVARLEAQLQDVEAELAEELTEIGARWTASPRRSRRRRSRSRSPTSRSPSSCWRGSPCRSCRCAFCVTIPCATCGLIARRRCGHDRRCRWWDSNPHCRGT